MAYREHGMWEVLDVLMRVHRGEGRRQIARVTGRARKTISRYVKVATQLGWAPEQDEPDEKLAAAVIARLQPGPKEVVVDSERALEPHKEELRRWLKPHDGYRRGLRLTKVLSKLERQGVHVSYSALYRFACKYLDFGRSASTVRVADVAPGELAEVDFGRLGLVFDPEAGRKRVTHALVVTLVHSRHQYVHITHSQALDDLITGIDDAWDFFGGVTARVVLDNLRAAVVKADRYEPAFQRTFNEYAKHRGFVIDAAVVRHPTGKPHVERQIQYVRDSLFRGEHWLDVAHVQREARTWCLSTAGGRIHGTTRKQPLVEFEASEKGALKPLRDERFDTPKWAELKVHPDQHIRFGQALYSVPYQHKNRPTKGKQTTVRGDSRLVRIYLDGDLIKTHAVKPKGGRSTDYGDYPPEKTAYAMRDANYIISKAKQRGASLGKFTEALLSGAYPWSMLRQAQKLMRLVDKYGAERVDAACQRAISFDLINVKRVERIIVQALDSPSFTETHARTRASVTQLPLKFLRPAQSFCHATTHPAHTEETDNGSPSIT